MAQKLLVYVVAFCILLFMLIGPARADSAATIESLQAQIKALQEQLDAVKAEQAAQAERLKAAPPAAPAQAQAPAEPGAGKTIFANTAVKVTLGGFIEMAGIARNRYEGSDVNSGFNITPAGNGNIPLQNSPNYYLDELRGSARQSRLSLLAQGQEDYAALAAYYEMDFLGGGSGTSGNSKESNSYNPRIRQIYATYDSTTTGFHLLGGQAWSLITLDKTGITPRQENIPMTIDAQYVPGFTWTRNPQVRLVKDFGPTLSAGLSVESPQALITAGGLKSGSSVNYSNQLANTNNYVYFSSPSNNSNEPSSLSLDEYPDIVGKVAIDPGFGHWEAYGLSRFFTDRTLIAGSRDNNTTFGWGAGAGTILPVLPKFLDFQASFLAGQGIGRYGSAQLYDAVINPITGKVEPLTEVEALAGLIGHPNDRLDIYTYAGFEQASRTAAIGNFGGFGNADYAPLSLITEGSTTSATNVEAAAVEQITGGFWYSFYKGAYGSMRVGVSDSYTRVRIFGLPNESMNVVMVSLRYYPF